MCGLLFKRWAQLDPTRKPTVTPVAKLEMLAQLSYGCATPQKTLWESLSNIHAPCALAALPLQRGGEAQAVARPVLSPCQPGIAAKPGSARRLAHTKPRPQPTRLDTTQP